jgi:hypothetical protein
MPVAHPNARAKLDREEKQQLIAISLSEAPRLCQPLRPML